MKVVQGIRVAWSRGEVAGEPGAGAGPDRAPFASLSLGCFGGAVGAGREGVDRGLRPWSAAAGFSVPIVVVVVWE